ncbi:MAG: phosphate acyltransferase PlsX [Oscillospiraceae bacterium]|nr:phosphate acyltransferase PlsX [Oscillospiraceae bacterium]
MKIIVDAMGGDNAPGEIVKGAISAAKARPGLEIVLVGREAEVRSAAGACGGLPGTVSVVNATEVIDMHDDPATAFKTKKDSSMTVGLTMLKNGEGDAFVSAGSTGALLSAGTLLVKRVRGIRRAAMAPLLPTAGKGLVLVDCGANAECTAEYLVQFAYLGSFYAAGALGLARPRVGLLNIGTEDSKGDALRQETYRLLREAGEAGRLNFIGNIEAKEAIKGGCDVVVADGFSGNVMLKTIEGVGSFMGKELKGMFLSSLKTKIAALLVKNGLAAFKERLDPDTIGGTPFLGLRKPVIKAHGASKARAVENAVYQAAAAAEADLAGRIEENIGLMNAGR